MGSGGHVWLYRIARAFWGGVVGQEDRPWEIYVMHFEIDKAGWTYKMRGASGSGARMDSACSIERDHQRHELYYLKRNNNKNGKKTV